MDPKDKEDIIAAAVDTVERECLSTEGDWRLGPVYAVFDTEKAKTILRALWTLGDIDG